MLKFLQKDSFKAQAQLHFIVLIWGSTALLGKWISLDSTWLVWYRTLIAALGLGILVKLSGVRFKVQRRALLFMALTGLVVCGHWLLFFASVKISNVSICLVGLSTTTLWTAILGPVINRTKPKWYEFLLGLLVMVGLVVIAQYETARWTGLGLAIGSAFCGALFSLLNGRLVQENHPYVLSFYEMVAANIFIFLVLCSTHFSADSAGWVFPKPTEWGGLLFLSIVCTVYAFAACVALYKKISVFASNLAINLEPVYGIIMASLFMNEHEEMSAGFYWGAALIVLAVLSYPFFVRLEKKNKVLGAPKRQ